MGGLLGKVHSAVHDIGSTIKDQVSGTNKPHGQAPQYGYGTTGAQGPPGQQAQSTNRFASFAPERSGNDIKWYVDACGYMWAVSRAIEQARESIWILDCTSW
jgi:phospholipase D1/2